MEKELTQSNNILIIKTAPASKANLKLGVKTAEQQPNSLDHTSLDSYDKPAAKSVEDDQSPTLLHQRDYIAELIKLRSSEYNRQLKL